MSRLLLFAAALLVAGAARAQTASLLATPELGPATAEAAPAGPTVYLAADEMPSFPGGAAKLVAFLAEKLHYPAAAADQKLSGKVHVTFTVDPEGHLHRPQVLRGLGAGLDEEALRLVRLMPFWNPGKVQGRPVWVQVTMPIVFRSL